jgi:hypothetical protein
VENDIDTVRDTLSRIPTSTASTQRNVFASRQTLGLQILKEPVVLSDMEIILYMGQPTTLTALGFIPQQIY